MWVVYNERMPRRRDVHKVAGTPWRAAARLTPRPDGAARRADARPYGAARRADARPYGAARHRCIEA